MSNDKPADDPAGRAVPAEEPASRPSTLGDAGMPSAGRPPAAGAPVDPHAPLSADGDTVRLSSVLPVPAAEPEVASGPRPADEAVEAAEEPTVVSRPVEADDEPTAVVEAPVAAGDEPADAEGDRRSFDGGRTMRLQPPFFAPGTTKTPRATPPAEEPSLLDGAVESRGRWESSPLSEAPAWSSGDETADKTPGSDRDTPGRRQDHFARAAAAADEKAAADRAADGAAADQAVADRAAEDDADEQAQAGKAVADKVPANEPVVTAAGAGDAADGLPAKAGRRLTSAGALIWVLLALLGFTLVVQLQSNDDDAGLATARQEDLVGILSDLEARDQRLQQEINALEESQRQLTSGVAGRQAALAEAGKRADELGLLSGTLPARGPGLKISIDPKGQPIKASAILNAVQELRGAGGEVMEIIGDNGVAVRIVASSYFVDADGGQVRVDGKQLSGPYTLWVIGVPSTMQTALQIPGGVVASVSQAGGNVTMEQRTAVEVAAVRQPTSLQYARPVS